MPKNIILAELATNAELPKRERKNEREIQRDKKERDKKREKAKERQRMRRKLNSPKVIQINHRVQNHRDFEDRYLVEN